MMPGMLRARAFQGLIPRQDLAARIACVPYDVVNREEAATLSTEAASLEDCSRLLNQSLQSFKL